MGPDRIRLIHLQTRTVDWHDVEVIPWDKVWTISHVWDRSTDIKIPLLGVSWRSASFASEDRFNITFEKVCQIVEPLGAEYVWMDAACIDQGRDKEKEEQVPFMRTIYSASAGCVAFGTLSPDDRFVPIISAYDDGRKAWVCDWFERVWTFQELRLAKVLLFVSGDHVLREQEVYFWILMMSPYLTPRYPLPPPHPNEPSLSIHDILNTLSPSSRSNIQRALMQTSKRGCSTRHIHDKVYGVLGVLAEPFSELKVDYNISLAEAVLNLMLLMPSKDVLDTLTFNTLPPADNVHNGLHWSGMVMLDWPTEHPFYETDIRHPTNAFLRVDTASGTPRACTVIHNAPLWKVVVTKPEDTHVVSAGTYIRTWPSIATLSRYAKLRDDFSKVERSAGYADVVGRAERSMVANWTLLKPLLETVCINGGGEHAFSILENPPSKGNGSNSLPPNRLGDTSLFGQEVTVLVCRSDENKLFHYGIVVTPNEDGSWHKVCTASFSDSCVESSSETRIERVVIIGK